MPKVARKYPKWWTRKTREEQEEYLRNHKRSRMKITRRRKKATISQPQTSENTAPVEEQVQQVLDGEPLVDKLPQKTEQWIANNTKTIQESVNKSLDDLSEQVKSKIENLPSKDKADLGNRVKKALTSPNVETTLKTTALFLAKVGVVSVGIAAAATAGAPVALALLALYEHKETVASNLDKPVNGLLGDYISNFFDGVREGLKDKKRIRNAVTEESPDYTDGDEKEETAGVSSNVTEQMKMFINMSKTDWNKIYASVQAPSIAWANALNRLKVLYGVERAAATMRILRMKFSSAEEMGYAKRCSMRVAELAVLRNDIIKDVDKLSGKFSDGKILKETAKAICQRYSVTHGSVPELAKTVILHNRRVVPVYRIVTDRHRVYIGQETAGTLLVSVVSRNYSATPRVLDTLSTKGRSLTSIMREFDLL